MDCASRFFFLFSFNCFFFVQFTHLLRREEVVQPAWRSDDDLDAALDRAQLRPLWRAAVEAPEATKRLWTFDNDTQLCLSLSVCVCV